MHFLNSSLREIHIIKGFNRLTRTKLYYSVISSTKIIIKNMSVAMDQKINIGRSTNEISTWRMIRTRTNRNGGLPHPNYTATVNNKNLIDLSIYKFSCKL